jgi:hypothetical protein
MAPRPHVEIEIIPTEESVMSIIASITFDTIGYTTARTLADCSISPGLVTSPPPPVRTMAGR